MGDSDSLIRRDSCGRGEQELCCADTIAHMRSNQDLAGRAQGALQIMRPCAPPCRCAKLIFRPRRGWVWWLVLVCGTPVPAGAA